MSFQNYGIQQNTVKKTDTSKQSHQKKANTTISKNIFKESLVHLDKQWDKWTEEMNVLNSDAETLERMFNSYDKDSKYLELRDIIIKKIEYKKSLLYELEKQVIQIKININNSRSE